MAALTFAHSTHNNSTSSALAQSHSFSPRTISRPVSRLRAAREARPSGLARPPQMTKRRPPHPTPSQEKRRRFPGQHQQQPAPLQSLWPIPPHQFRPRRQMRTMIPRRLPARRSPHLPQPLQHPMRPHPQNWHPRPHQERRKKCPKWLNR